MATPNKNDMIKKMAAKRNAEQAERAANARKNSFSQNAMLFIGEKIVFNEKDKNKTSGTIIGYQLKNNEKQHIEVYIAPENIEKNIKGKQGNVSGGVIDAGMETQWFPYEELSRDKKTVISNPSKFLSIDENQYFTDNVKTLVEKLYPQNIDQQKIMLIADNPTRVGSKKTEIDGETVEVVSYKVNWLTPIAVGSQLTNNVYENAIFSFKSNTYTHEVNGKTKKIAEIADQVLVWQTDENNVLKAVPFSDNNGVQHIMNTLEEQMNIQLGCLKSPETKYFTKLFEVAKAGRPLSYIPTVSFGITVPLSQEDMENSNTKKTHSTKVILLPLQQHQKTQRIKFEMNEDGSEFLKDEEGDLIPVYEYNDEGEVVGYDYEKIEVTNANGETEEQVMYSTITPLDLDILMEAFRAKIHDAEDPIHKELKASYPDLNIDELNDDNYVIFFAKAFNYMSGRDHLNQIIDQFKEIANDTNLGEKQKENAWNDLVYQTVTSGNSKDKAMLAKVSLYNWDGTFSEETLKEMRWAVKSVTTTYGVTSSLKMGRRGVFHAFKGIVTGGSLNEYDGSVYFYPSSSNVKPYSWNGRNLMSYYYPHDYNPENENEGGLFLELDMLKSIHLDTDKTETEEKDNSGYQDEYTSTKSKAEDKKAKEEVKNSMESLISSLDDDDEEGNDSEGEAQVSNDEDESEGEAVVEVKETKTTKTKTKKEKVVEVDEETDTPEIDIVNDDIPF